MLLTARAQAVRRRHRVILQTAPPPHTHTTTHTETYKRTHTDRAELATARFEADTAEAGLKCMGGRRVQNNVSVVDPAHQCHAKHSSFLWHSFKEHEPNINGATCFQILGKASPV